MLNFDKYPTTPKFYQFFRNLKFLKEEYNLLLTTALYKQMGHQFNLAQGIRQAHFLKTPPTRGMRQHPIVNSLAPPLLTCLRLLARWVRKRRRVLTHCISMMKRRVMKTTPCRDRATRKRPTPGSDMEKQFSWYVMSGRGRSNKTSQCYERLTRKQHDRLFIILFTIVIVRIILINIIVIIITILLPLHIM